MRDKEASTMRLALHDKVPAAHAAMAGHFPGHPIVPAVVILDRVRGALDRWAPGARMTRIEHVKFIDALRPGEGFTITVSSDDMSWFLFKCTKENGSCIASGKFCAEGVD